jgi:hypothetical protein
MREKYFAAIKRYHVLEGSLLGRSKRSRSNTAAARVELTRDKEATAEGDRGRRSRFIRAKPSQNAPTATTCISPSLHHIINGSLVILNNVPSGNAFLSNPHGDTVRDNICRMHRIHFFNSCDKIITSVYKALAPWKNNQIS